MTKAIRKQEITPLLLKNLKPQQRGYLVWDTKQGGLALAVQPSGFMSWKAIYAYHGRTRWFTIGAINKIGLAEARKLTQQIMAQKALGQDPQGEKRALAKLKPVTFAAIAQRYVNEYARKANKSWEQADRLIRRLVLPQWGGKDMAAITRADVKELMRSIAAPAVANQTLRAASAIFTWAIKEEIAGVKANPCQRIELNEMKDRERVLSDSELPLFWSAFEQMGVVGRALKAILLTGQRPGEIAHMRREHIKDHWWEMPGNPQPDLQWPGTKNGQSHRVWLAAPVRELIAARDGGFVFGAARFDEAMRRICADLSIADKVTPHDLRRTFSTCVTRLGYGRDGMNRVTNHKEGGIGSVYDRHEYADENKRIMEAVAGHILQLATGEQSDDKVVALRRRGGKA
jgi:integrase